MSDQQSFASAVMGELSRRKVLRTLGAYAVAVFVILQLLDAAVEPLRLPEWFPTLVIIALILGFPVVFVLGWLFDVTGKGIQRTRDVSLLSRGQSLTLFSLMFVLTGVMGLSFYRYYSAEFEGPQSLTTSISQSERTFTAPANSIAVLPFADLSADKDQAHISDGVSEEILNLLAQVDGLHVAARTSSFAFREPQTDIREIGKALNVSTVLEGSIRTSGDKIRLTAQLINVEDGYHIWSQNYDREMTDIFALQDEVASAIASALVESFSGLNDSPGSRTQNVAAFEAYRTGRLHWWRRTPQELQKAIELFANALEHDAQYAPAYAGLADSFILLSLYGNITQEQAIDRAMPMIEKALSLDPESAEAFAALGLARMNIDQLDSSESALRTAIELNEDYIPARLWLASLLGQQGRIGEQGVVLRDAMALDPLNELLAINYAFNLNTQGNYDGAQDLLTSLKMVKPDSATLLRTMSGLSMARGDLVDAWTNARQAYDLEPESPAVIGMLAKVWMELGEIEKAETLLQEGLAIAEDNADLNSQYFVLLVVDGRVEEAERVVKETFGSDIERLPENFQRFYHFQTGLIRIVTENFPQALREFELAINPNPVGKFDGDQLFSLTMAAFLHEEMGHEEQAAERLEQAEQAIRRARINGIDDPEIYYTESVIQVLNDQPQKALASLKSAYDKGWRQNWVLRIDGRLDPLRDRPEFIEIQQAIIDDINRARNEVQSRSLAQL